MTGLPLQVDSLSFHLIQKPPVRSAWLSRCGTYIRPYTHRGVVDSIHYNQQSVLRAIGELPGMSPWHKLDASTLPMRSMFLTEPNLTLYTAVPNRFPLDVLNPSVEMLLSSERAVALQSLTVDFFASDAAPEELLNEILWHTAPGWDTHYPHVPHGFDCPLGAC